ncbi:MAG: hypothetical protein ACRDP7_15235, partial [Trebonia sp.]
MAVDRVEERGAARRTADTPAGTPADAAATVRGETAARTARTADDTEPERQAITRRLHRVLVDHAYGVGRDAWAEAVPDLRAAWENHKNRYPERWRPPAQTTADGSW